MCERLEEVGSLTRPTLTVGASLAANPRSVIAAALMSFRRESGKKTAPAIVRSQA